MAFVLNNSLDEKQAECTCAPCKAFWNKAFHSGSSRILKVSEERAELTAILGCQKGLLRKGDRVVVDKKLPGVVKYVGFADDHLIAPEMHVGVSLYDNVYSTHNGLYKGKRFFYCPRGHGAMVKYSQVTPLSALPRSQNLVGNPMFPSYDEVKKRRKEREKKIKEAEENLIKEKEVRRRVHFERYTKSAPPPRISPRQTKASMLRIAPADLKPRQPAQDEYDIVYQDYLKSEGYKEKPMDPAYQEELQFRQMKKAFGGDEKAKRMAETLLKLHHAYEEGKIVSLAERE